MKNLWTVACSGKRGSVPSSARSEHSTAFDLGSYHAVSVCVDLSARVPWLILVPRTERYSKRIVVEQTRTGPAQRGRLRFRAAAVGDQLGLLAVDDLEFGCKPLWQRFAKRQRLEPWSADELLALLSRILTK